MLPPRRSSCVLDPTPRRSDLNLKPDHKPSPHQGSTWSGSLTKNGLQMQVPRGPDWQHHTWEVRGPPELPLVLALKEMAVQDSDKATC